MLTNHIGIKVKNAERSQKFYCENLGFTLDHKYENENVILVFLKNENSVIELIHKKNVSYDSVQKGIVEHVAFTVDDIHAYVNKLKNNNVKFISDGLKEVDGKMIMFFQGPDGEKLELVQFINK